VDVLDHVLDKGIVIDAWVRLSVVGIDLITIEARVVVASIETYLQYADVVAGFPSVSRPATPPKHEAEQVPSASRVFLEATGLKGRVGFAK